MPTKKQLKKEVDNLEQYNEEKSKIARIKRFQFRQEKGEPPLDILIPPRPVEEEAKTQKIKDIIELEKSALLRKYESEIEERDNISRGKGIERILEGLGNILTSFKIIKSRLYDSPEEAIELNAGIKLSQGSGKQLEKNFFATSTFNIYVNYPPNYIELDVSDVTTFYMLVIYIDYLFQKYSYKDIKEKKSIPQIDLSILKEFTKKFSQGKKMSVDIERLLMPMEFER